MKKLFLIFLVALGNTVLAQDIFQQHLYSPEMVMKYRDEAGLSPEQVEKITSICNTGIPTYNDKKWGLDASITALEKLISQNTIDLKAASIQLDKSLALETELKKLRLDILVKVKNILTPTQQAKLDAHKDEPSSSFIISPLNDNHRMELKISGPESSTSPLYIIIDRTGKKTEAESPKALNSINPSDIESMQVIKGERAIEAYGKRGANGVVLINLK